jgi:hypothetical protein
MKKLFGILWIISTVGLYSCKKEEVITATEPPYIDFSSVENPFQEDSIIHAAKGKSFTIEALLLDQVGIKSFNVHYPDWYLNNTIVLTEYYPDEILYDYDLSFNFKVPGDVDEEEEFVLKLTTTNLGNLYTEKNVVIRLDGDYVAPVILDIEPGNNSTVSSQGFRIKFRVQDNEKLKYVVFKFPHENVYDSITSFRGGKAYSYDQPFEGLPNGKYDFYIRAVDMYENSREKSVNFSISD